MRRYDRNWSGIALLCPDCGGLVHEDWIDKHDAMHDKLHSVLVVRTQKYVGIDDPRGDLAREEVQLLREALNDEVRRREQAQATLQDALQLVESQKRFIDELQGRTGKVVP